MAATLLAGRGVKTSKGNTAQEVRSGAAGTASLPLGRSDRATIAHQGVVVPTERDRLDIVQPLTAAPTFPVDVLPPLMRGAVAALVEHVQAPLSLCAHSILSAGMLVAQGLADIEVGPLSEPRPLSLFMLVVAVSGERKSACDSLALIPVKEYEDTLRERHRKDEESFRTEMAAFNAEKRLIERNNKISAFERLSRLQGLKEPVGPLLPTRRATEPNLEGLLNLVANGHASVGVFTSEGGQGVR